VLRTLWSLTLWQTSELEFIGLDDGWAARIIETVGNYGEIFERDLGAGSPMKLALGPNNLWTHGGLVYAIPMR